MFLCPLCGKQNSIRYYHPETFDDDVEIFHNASHGRGRPFEKILGFSIEEFPELHEKLGIRAQRVSEFLSPQPMTDVRINELEKQIEEENKKRTIAEDQLEELDIEFLLYKVEGSLGAKNSDVHAAVDDLINRNRNLSESNRNMNSITQGHEALRLRLEQEKRNLATEKALMQTENTVLRENIGKWGEAYRSLEAQHQRQNTEHQTELTLERNLRIQLEDNLEELDVDVLIHRNRALEKERTVVLNFINNELPEKYDYYYDLEAAIAAFSQYYEDQIEEFSDE